MATRDAWAEVEQRLAIVVQVDLFEEGSYARVLSFVRTAVWCHWISEGARWVSCCRSCPTRRWIIVDASRTDCIGGCSTYSWGSL